MGLGKMLGFGGKGKIHVNTEKPTYFPGEIVNGNVFCDIKEPIECEAVVMKCKGKEKVYWQETRTRTDDEGHSHTYEVDFDAKKDFFVEKIVLSAVAQKIPVGQWVYPFSFQLPMGIPPSFSFKDSCWRGGENNKIKAKVEYKFKGTVEAKGSFAKDLKGDAKVVIMDAPVASFPPGKMEKTQDVKFCCCISKGEVELGVEMDKGAYFVGETAQIRVDIKNDCAYDIEKMKAKLYRTLILRADGHTKKFKHEMNRMEYEGVKEGDEGHQLQQLPLHGEFLPQTESKHITCRYQVEIECAVPWCPDVELHVPLGLYEAPRVQWGYTPPAGLEYYPPPPM